jgi:hypothetical protein
MEVIWIMPMASYCIAVPERLTVETGYRVRLPPLVKRWSGASLP